MAITSYNVAPYHDDINIKDAQGKTVLDKNYLRILFQPGFAIQTREMNQLQSVLQSQIDRFGSSFYRDGQAVLDGEASFRDNVVYVEVTLPTGVTLADLTSDILLQPTIEIRTNGITGGQYAKVLGIEGITAEVIRIYLQSISDISDSSSASAALDTLVPTGATLHYKEDIQFISKTGTLNERTVANTSPIATISANGYGFSASVNEGIFYVKGSFVHTPAIKRFWIKNSYDEIVRGDVVLAITEKIVTSAQDSTLLDNSTGSYNFSGPGADRYSISLDLAFFENSEPENVLRNIVNQGANFYVKNSQQTFDIARLFTTDEQTVESVENTESNNLEKKLAKRTFEESGNYTIKPFKVGVREMARVPLSSTTVDGVTTFSYDANADPVYTQSELIDQKPFNIGTVDEASTKVIFQVDPSTAYINGFRYDFQDKINLISDKARDDSHVKIKKNINISLQQGNYIELDVHDNPHYQLSGNNPRTNVSFGGFAATDDVAASPTKPWTVDNVRAANINSQTTSTGYNNSKVKSIQFVSSQLRDVRKSDGTNYKSVIGTTTGYNISSNPTAAGVTFGVAHNSSPTATYRVYLHNKSTFQDILDTFPHFVNRKGLTDGTTPYQLGNHSPSELNVLGTQVASNAITVNNTSENSLVFRLPADAVQRVTRVKYTKYKKFEITVGTSNITGTFGGDGKTVEIPLNTSSAVGGLLNGESLVGTSKTDKFDYLVTVKTTRTGESALHTSTDLQAAGVDAQPGIDGTFERLVNPRHFEIKDGATSAQVVLKGLDGVDHHFAFKEDDVVTVFAPVEVEVGGDDGGAVGRQKIKTSHIQNIGGVTYSSGTVIELDKADVIISSIGSTLLSLGENFEVIDDGLNDPEFYRKPKIRLTQSVTFTGSNDILFDYYKHGEGDFFCVNSYGNYSLSAEPSLKYEQIPRFNNQPLSEFLDFRVKETFLAEDARDVGDSQVGPISLVPNRTCQVDMNYYVGRFDRLIIGDNGVIEIVKGLPSENPVVPPEPENSMTLYTIFMPPYTRSAKTINTRYINNQRSTMKDITRIKDRVSAIEYYSSLSLLENSALQKNLINEDGSSRFKNGIIVDNFTQDKTANALDPNYLAATDKTNGILRPYFHSNQFRLFYKFPAGIAANQSSAANYVDRSTTEVEDFYINNSPNNFKFNVLTQKVDPKTGRPQQLNVVGFTINTIDDINTNGVYTLYNPNTNGFPEYRYVSGNVALSESSRRIVKVTSEAGVTRWEIQSIKADKTGYETLYFSELPGFAGIGAPLPNLVAGGWKNVNLEDMPNVKITLLLEEREGGEETNPESASAKLVDRIVRTGQNNREMLSLWNGTKEELFNQPNASRTVSVQPYEVTQYEGIVKLSPSGDEWIDTNRRPAQIIQDNTALEVLTFLDENTDVFEGVLGAEWNNWETLSQGLQSTSDTFVTNRGGFVIDTIEIDESRVGTNTTLESNTTIEESQGDRVVNINIVPFIRSRDISIYCSGLKPNTRLYFFFDGKDVTRYVAATENFHEYSIHEQVKEYNDELEPDSTVAGGPFQTPATGANHYDLPLFSLAETGEFFGTLRIPNNENMRFRTGLKQFKVTSSSTNNEEEADTIAETTYSAFGLNQTIEETITSTRVPEIVTTQISERRTRAVERQRWLWRRDPIAQTFTIPEIYGDGVCVTDIDIFFAEKPAFPVDVQVYLVPTESGIPTNKVIPGSRVSLPNSQVKVPQNGRDETDASKIEGTNFLFDYPIHLKAGCEYAVVVFSPSPDYRVWVAELGRPNIMNANIPITTNSDIGVLLKSQNTKTWTADQTKDLMFRLHKGIFKLSHTFEFNTKASTEATQGLGEFRTATGERNIRLSSFNIASDTLKVPGTTLTFDIDFNKKGGGNLINQEFGIPDTLLAKTTYELTSAIDTYRGGSDDIDNIVVKATMTGKDRGDGFSDITPMIDLDKHSLFTFDNVIQTSAQAKVDAGTVYTHINEARKAQFGFVTKNIKLANPADELKIFMKTNRLAASGNLEVYAKVRGVGDDCPWGNKLWEKCSVADLSGKTEIDIGGYSPSIAINGDLDTFSESEFILKAENIPAGDTDINEIIEYALKIGFVNDTSDSAKIVKVKDLRVIATA